MPDEHRQRLDGFEFEEDCLADLNELRHHWDGRLRWLRRRHPRRARCEARPDVPSLLALMITTPDRQRICEETLSALAATDWGDIPVEALVDMQSDPNRRLRVLQQGYRALTRFLSSSADYLLFLEDDLEFNRHFRYNIEQWPVLRTREVTLAGLYNPGLHEIAYDVARHAIAVDPAGAYGNQALLISRSTAEHAVRHWTRHVLPLDHRLVQLAAELEAPIYRHAPSLVQHRAVPSTWGGCAHQAIDFDPHWKQASPGRRQRHTSPRVRRGVAGA